MTKTITLTDLVVEYIRVDYENQRVFVGYKMVDNNGVKWEGGEAVFWLVIPEVDPVPDNWFQLPTSYIPILVSLQTDADAALTAKFLV